MLCRLRRCLESSRHWSVDYSRLNRNTDGRDWTVPAMRRRDDLVRFYGLLTHLEDSLRGTRKLADCNGRMKWPERGMYFFMEEGEQRTDSGTGLRIVRVG